MSSSRSKKMMLNTNMRPLNFIQKLKDGALRDKKFKNVTWDGQKLRKTGPKTNLYFQVKSNENVENPCKIFREYSSLPQLQRLWVVEITRVFLSLNKKAKRKFIYCYGSQFKWQKVSFLLPSVRINMEKIFKCSFQFCLLDQSTIDNESDDQLNDTDLRKIYSLTACPGKVSKLTFRLFKSKAVSLLLILNNGFAEVPAVYHLLL